MYILSLIGLSILLIILLTTKFEWHPFLVLILVAFLFGLFAGMPPLEVINTINQGFGNTIGKIGLIIIIGIIIGTFLENSGAAYVLADAVLKLVGQKRVHEAMGLIGYIVCIPVFADSGFIILSSLSKALTKKAGCSLAGTAVALSMGLLATHTMVPPTPGPIAAAGILGADLGLVIMIGLVVSFGSLIVVVFFSKKMGEMIWIEADPELSEEQIAQRLQQAPSSLKSFLPIVVPIFLIILKSIADYPSHPFGTGQLANILVFIGNPVTALSVGLLFALLLPKKLDKAMLSTSGWAGTALSSAAVIILITGAGGAFGMVLQSTDVGSTIGEMVKGSKLGIWLPFLVAAAIKSAQGSSTVAIITTASLISPLLVNLGPDTEVFKAMVVVAIGAGSAVFSHANDSFFWVVTQMSQMNVKQGYLLHSTGSAILGFSAILLLTLLSFCFLTFL